jgi:hypothetical protein
MDDPVDARYGNWFYNYNIGCVLELFSKTSIRYGPPTSWDWVRT